MSGAHAKGRPEPDGSASTRHFRVGTIKLTLPDRTESRQLFADAQAIRELSDHGPKPDSDRWRRVVAVGGVLQGLLDFEDIGPAELSDVFGEAELDDDSLLAFHKGTLLSISIAGEKAAEKRETKLAIPIGISPYLAVPHAVLLHNEQLVKSALIRANDQAHVLSRREELQNVLDRRRRRRDRWTLGLTITFFALGALQAALTHATEAVPWWGYVLILAAIGALLAQFRKQLF